MRKQLRMPPYRPAGERGFTLIEVLVTFIVLAIGLLGLAQVMSRMHQVEMESYQRSQAVLLLQDMAARVSVAGLNASGYVTGTSSPLGTGDTAHAPPCTNPGTAAYDLCLWSSQLQGASETKSSTKVGAMIGARGCIEQIQAPNTTTGSCQAGIYRVSVAWQGLTLSTVPALACGQNQYGSGTNDAQRRVVSTKVTIGTPAC